MSYALIKIYGSMEDFSVWRRLLNQEKISDVMKRLGWEFNIRMFRGNTGIFLQEDMLFYFNERTFIKFFVTSPEQKIWEGGLNDMQGNYSMVS